MRWIRQRRLPPPGAPAPGLSCKPSRLVSPGQSAAAPADHPVPAERRRRHTAAGPHLYSLPAREGCIRRGGPHAPHVPPLQGSGRQGHRLCVRLVRATGGAGRGGTGQAAGGGTGTGVMHDKGVQDCLVLGRLTFRSTHRGACRLGSRPAPAPRLPPHLVPCCHAACTGCRIVEAIGLTPYKPAYLLLASWNVLPAWQSACPAAGERVPCWARMAVASAVGGEHEHTCSCTSQAPPWRLLAGLCAPTLIPCILKLQIQPPVQDNNVITKAHQGLEGRPPQYATVGDPVGDFVRWRAGGWRRLGQPGVAAGGCQGWAPQPMHSTVRPASGSTWGTSPAPIASAATVPRAVVPGASTVHRAGCCEEGRHHRGLHPALHQGSVVVLWRHWGAGQ